MSQLHSKLFCQSCVGSYFLSQLDPFPGSCMNKDISNFWIFKIVNTVSQCYTLWYGSRYGQEVNLFLHAWTLLKTNSIWFLFSKPHIYSSCPAQSSGQAMLTHMQKLFIYMHTSHVHGWRKKKKRKPKKGVKSLLPLCPTKILQSWISIS